MTGAAGARREAAGAWLTGLLLLMLVPVLASCGRSDAAAGPSALRLDPVDLNPHRPERRDVDRLRFEAGFRLRTPDERFGGFSGLWLADDGSRMIAGSDGGTLFDLALEHDADGRLTGVRVLRAVVPGTLDDDPTFHLDQNVEALAEVAARDHLVLAYEGTHRLRGVPMSDLAAVPEPWPVPGALVGRGNRGMEALVDLPDGRLLTLLEGGDRQRDGWIVGRAGVAALDYVAEFGFEPTGADRLGDQIWVLERRFSWIGGFQSRIVRLPVGEVAPGARLEGEEIARLRPPLTTENFEAIAVRRDAAGRTFVYLLSDDNFNLVQRTLLMQFSLIE
ncbi:MAG TPA: esterase-like activity of phytase family protein [Geminicoccaceae bacterium]